MGIRVKGKAGLANLPDWPFLMRDCVAAVYLSLTEAEFDQGVRQGELPMPRRTPGGLRWSRRDLDGWFEADSGAIADERDALAAAIDAAWAAP